MRNKIIYSICVIAVLLIALFFLEKNKEVYGNDVESIIQVINSIDLYEDTNIEIIDIFDQDKSRIVSFLSNGNPAFIEFKDKGNNKYKYQCSEVDRSDKFNSFFISIFGENSSHNYVLSINGYSDLIRLKFKANNDIYEVGFEKDVPAAKWTKLKPSSDNSYSFEWYPETYVSNEPRKAQVCFEQSLGADMVSLDYASDDKIIFHDYFGLFVYNLNTKEIVTSIDLKEINCDSTQGDEYCEVSVNSQGNLIQLHNMSKDYMYLFNLENNILSKSPYLPMEAPFKLLDFYEVYGETGSIHSDQCVSFENGEIGYLESIDFNIGTIRYIRGDRIYEIFDVEAYVANNNCIKYSFYDRGKGWEVKDGSIIINNTGKILAFSGELVISEPFKMFNLQIYQLQGEIRNLIYNDSYSLIDGVQVKTKFTTMDLQSKTFDYDLPILVEISLENEKGIKVRKLAVNID
jgi:hypothetical protein